MNALRPILLAGIAAGVVSTLVQVALWVALAESFPSILFRDARLAAAIVLGPSVLASAETFDLYIMVVASVVHFALSIAFAAALPPFLARRSWGYAALGGAAFGALLYVLALHVMTLVFPWFAVARGAVTLAAHVAFGVSAAVVYRYARREAGLP